MHRNGLVIVTPALAQANNGNWQTARRWASMLRQAYRVEVARRWRGGDQALMIALHARRSAAAVAAWRARHPERPLLLVLTGTDLYRDIDTDPQARHALRAADALVVLNELGARRLPAPLRPRCHVILQSCRARRPLARTPKHLRAVAVGHLRAEKDPGTLLAAARLLADRADLRIDHIGAALEARWGREARALMRQQGNYRWLGPLPHGQARRRIQAAHLLVHPSRIEGGAHVVIEAIRSGTAVLASRIDGNVGLLGAGYDGFFPAGNAAALARLLRRARDEPGLLDHLQRQCAERAPLFDPAREAEALRTLVATLLARSPPRGGRTAPAADPSGTA